MSDPAIPQIEYASESELLTEYKNYMDDPDNLERATHYLYNALMEETIMGLVFEIHYLNKTGLDKAIDGCKVDQSE